MKSVNKRESHNWKSDHKSCSFSHPISTHESVSLCGLLLIKWWKIWFMSIINFVHDLTMNFAYFWWCWYCCWHGHFSNGRLLLLSCVDLVTWMEINWEIVVENNFYSSKIQRIRAKVELKAFPCPQILKYNLISYSMSEKDSVFH